MLEFDATKTIKNIVQADIQAIPIGNHELNRHLVYRVIDNMNHSVIIKFYYKKNRCNREIATLKLLSSSNVKCPKLIDYGFLEDGTEWVITEYKNGEVFDKIRNTISYNDQIKIIEEMGKELGKIHSLQTFDFFGNWDECGKGIDKYQDYKSFFINSSESILQELYSQQLPEDELLKKAAKLMQGQYHLIDCINESRLCHNDYDGRNILVNYNINKWQLISVIDFEQSYPGNVESDIAGLYHTYFLYNKEFEKAFFRGYNEYLVINTGFHKRLNLYLLRIGLSICSWAYTQAPEYYKSGIGLLKRVVYSND